MVQQTAVVSDAILAARQLKELLRCGRKVEVELLVALGDFECRKRHEALGYRSFWYFLTAGLKILECAAFYRMHGSRLVARFPGVVPRMEDGRLCPTILVELRDVLDESNAETLFEKVVGKSRNEVKDIVNVLRASREPAPESGEPTGKTYTIRKAPRPVAKVVRNAVFNAPGPVPPFPFPAPVPTPTPEAPAPTPTAEPAPQPAPVVLLVPSRERKSELRALGEDLYDLSMRVRKTFVDRLAEAKLAEGHAVPDGDIETILLRGLELLIERSGKKTGKLPVKSNKRTRELRQDPDSAYVSSSLRQAVFTRDGHCCQWAKAEGGLCASRERLEPDHIRSRAKGGKTELSNLRTLCHEHNAQAAREQLGAGFVARKIQDARAARDRKRSENASGLPASSGDPAPVVSVSTKEPSVADVSGLAGKPPPEPRRQGS